MGRGNTHTGFLVQGSEILFEVANLGVVVLLSDSWMDRVRCCLDAVESLNILVDLVWDAKLGLDCGLRPNPSLKEESAVG